jgi:hypothetical protein
MTSRVHSGRAVGFALLASCVLAGCETKLTELTDAVGPIAFNFAVGPAAAGLPSGTVAVGATSVTLTLSGLRALAAGQYQFWVLGRDPQNLDVSTEAFGTIKEFFRRVDTLPDGTPHLNPVTGDTIFVTDSISISDIRTAGYAGSDDPFVTSIRVILDSTADGTNPATHHAVYVTLETAAATSPGPAQFLWRRIGVGGAGAMLFGNFGGSDVVNVQSPRDYVFGPRGAGSGGARGPELSVDFREVARPPVGFFYCGYVVNALGDGVVVDTLRSAWSRDPSTSRLSLYDADVNALLPDIEGGDIRSGQVRNCAAGSGVNNCQNTMALTAVADSTFRGLENFQLKLEPKGGVAPIRNRSVSLVGPLPKLVK